jgi:hypothetical protein
MARLLIASFLLAITCAALPAKAQTGQLAVWPEEPDGFKGIQFGWTEKQSKSVVHWARPGCFPFKGSRLCTMLIDGGGFTITAYFTFDANGFSMATGHFPSGNYEAVRDMFVAKYGEPHHADQSWVQNGMGATFQQEDLSWSGTHVHIALSRFGTTVTEGFFGIGTLAGWEADHEKAAREKALQ